MIQKQYLDKARLFVSGIFVFLLPLDSMFLPHLIGLLALLGVVQFNKETFLDNIDKYKYYFMFFVLFYLWQSISLVWTEDITKGLKSLEYKGFYMVAPFVFLLYKKWPTEQLIKVFIISNFLICLYCFAKLFPFFIYEKWYFIEKTKREGISLHTFRYLAYHGGANFIFYGVHRLYVSFSIITSLLFLAFYKKLFKYRILKHAMIFVFALVILLLQSKISVILFSVLFLFFLIKMFKSSNFRKRVMILTIFVITISLGYYLNKIRFGQFVDQIENVNTSKGGSFIERYQYANCSFELIQESLIFGFGVGDVDEKIKQKLIKYNYKFLLDRGVYDPHNEFLKAYIGMGIIGFLCFMGIFVSIFYQLSKRKNILLFFYMGFVFVLCLIEPFLSRQAGILPALFFIGLLVDGHKNKFENGRYV